MTALSVAIACKAYPARNGNGALKALQDLRFSVAENDFVCILGPSGCGKTTALNIIAGLDKDFSGGIAFGEGMTPSRLAYVFQTPRLLPWRSVLDNVMLAAGSDPDAMARSRTLIADVGLGGFERTFPGQLSLGMQRRAALARAFATQPSILLMDEPFVSLDEDSAVHLRSLLLSLWRERPVTVIFVTHDSREAIQLGQRIILLTASPGKLLADLRVPLSPEERADPAAVEAYRAEKFTVYAKPRALGEQAQYNAR